MGKVNPGKRFEGKLQSSFEDAGMYVQRIPDKVYWTGQRLVSEETPADFFACYTQGADGILRSFLVEAKACSKHRIQYSQLKEHQARALRDFAGMHRDMHGYVAVNYYDPVSLNRLDVCFMVPIDVWDEHAAGDMKSLAHEDCLEDPRITLCQKVKGGVYDMGKWLASVAPMRA